MTIPLTTALLNDVRDQAYDECMSIALALIKAQLGDDGEAFGDSPLGAPDRIARVLDLAQRGVMDVLQVRSPKVYEQFTRQFIHDIADGPLTGQQEAA